MSDIRTLCYRKDIDVAGQSKKRLPIYRFIVNRKSNELKAAAKNIVQTAIGWIGKNK
jgi:hypothetical protein